MKRTTWLLSVLAAALLLIAGCSTAEEAGEAVSEVGSPPAGSVADESEPPEVESEVITEPALQEDASEPTADAGGDSGSSDDILAIAQDNPQLSQLVTALEAAGLTDVLEQAGPLTVFAPNNDAFAQLDQSDLTALLSNPQELTGILQYHVVEGDYPSSELSDGQTLTTLSGEDLTVSIDGDTVTVGNAEVVQADVQAGNGTIHVIDTVLQP
jgi:uncharacterized surface protein with fasciclin (FAS1) repeats/predicted small secreted protein